MARLPRLAARRALSRYARALLGGPAIPIINGAPSLILQNYHTLQKVDASNTGTIVFTGTDSYYVQAAVEGNV